MKKLALRLDTKSIKKVKDEIEKYQLSLKVKSEELVNRLLDVVKNEKTYNVPTHLQDAHYGGAGKLGHGVGYKYAHDYKNHYVKQQYLPDELVGRVFYEPTDNGYEKHMKEHMERIKAEA